ncbi:MAG TPA: hypothetical protein VNG53_07295 [Bacteroidia bacterium]|nr:hypothetical protein [Bacteroidia bacterium]
MFFKWVKCTYKKLIFQLKINNYNKMNQIIALGGGGFAMESDNNLLY